jgi:hypothetical protein
MPHTRWVSLRSTHPTKLTANPDETIEKLKTSFLFSRLQDREIEAAIKALEMILKSRHHSL